MNRDRAQKTRQPYNTLVNRAKNYNPTYKKQKVFTLKDLDDSFEEPAVQHQTHQPVIKANDLLAPDVDDTEFEELKKLALGTKEPAQKKTALKKARKKKVVIKEQNAKTAKKKKKNHVSNSNFDRPKPVKAKVQVKEVKNKQQKLIDEFITVDASIGLPVKKNKKEEIKKKPVAKNNNPKPKTMKQKQKSLNMMESFEERTRKFEERKAAKKQKLEEEFKKINCFKPKINAKSRKIDKVKQQSGENNRQEKLYVQGQELIAKKEQLKDKVEMDRFEEQGEEEIKHLTFKPKLNKYKGNIGLSMEERNRQWEEKKREKLEKIKESRKDNDLEGCTFAPKINK